MLLSNNHSTGGTCFGDSGGPNFLGDSSVVAGVTLFWHERQLRWYRRRVPHGQSRCPGFCQLVSGVSAQTRGGSATGTAWQPSQEHRP